MSNTSQASRNPAPSTGVDQVALYGNYDESVRRREAREDEKHRFYMKSVHKGSNIREDVPGEEMDVHNEDNRTITSGMDWKTLAVVAGSALGGLYLYNDRPQPTPQPPTVISAPVIPGGSQEGNFAVEVEIRDKITGEPIRVDWLNEETVRQTK